MMKMGIAAALCAGAILYILWNSGALLPQWIIWEESSLSAGGGQYTVELAQKKVDVRCDGAVVWSSPADVKVQAAESLDIDGDGQEELLLLCWKRGRYGRYMPFWVDRDEKKWSQHLFVYAYAAGEIRPKWMSSYMGQDVSRMRVQAAESGKGRLWLKEPGGAESCWIWDSWGFVKAKTEVTFTVFGDNLIHEPLYDYGLAHDGAFGFLFENFQDAIAQSDVAVINQETPLTDSPARYSGYPRFGTPQAVGQAIVDAGFDVVTCATNHALDQGPAGADATKAFFEDHDILCLGICPQGQTEEEPYEILARNSIRFALFNYTYGINGMETLGQDSQGVYLLGDEEQIKRDMWEAKERADMIIVFVHWGTEGAVEPDAFQKKWARVFLEGQADVVVGTHSHTLQPCTVMRDEDGHEMLVYYSLGNFISAQPEKTCVRGGMASFTITLTPEGSRIDRYSLQPLRIRWMQGGKYQTDYAVFDAEYRPLYQRRYFSHVSQE